MPKAMLKKTSHKYAALYFLLTLIFSVLYWIFSSHLKEESASFISSFYFSVVTITTLGFGDVTPITDTMKLVVALEAISGVVVIGLFINSLMNEQSAKEQLNKHIELLENIQRGLYRIGEASIDFRIYIPLNSVNRREYESLLQNIGVLSDGEVNTGILPKVGVFTYQNNNHGPWRFNVPFDSQLRPQGILGSVTREHFFTVEIYRNHRSVDDITCSPNSRRPPDLAVEVQTEILGNCNQSTVENHAVYYDVQNGGFEVEARDYEILPKHWYYSGAISSSLDLMGCQVVIRTQKKNCFADKNEDAKYDEIKKRSLIKWLTLDIRGFPRICLQDFRFSKCNDYDGYQVFVTSIPNTLDELRKLHPVETLEYQSKVSGAKDGTLFGWFRL